MAEPQTTPDESLSPLARARAVVDSATTSADQPAPTPPTGGMTLEQAQETVSAAQIGKGFRFIPETSYPSIRSERLEGIGLGVGTGGATGATVAGSMIGGARIGASLPVPPQYKPFTAAAGAVFGLGAGLVGSSIVNDLLESQVPTQYLNDPELIPYYQGGRTFGETLGAAPFVFAIPEIAGGKVSNYISAIGNEARSAPRRTLASEVSSGIGAGLVGGSILAYDPEATGKRFVGEMLGGSNLLFNTAQNAAGLLSMVKTRFGSDKAINEQATAWLIEQLDAGKEDVKKLIERLNSGTLPQGPGMPTMPEGARRPTSAAKTGSLVLGALANTLARGNSRFGTQLQQQDREALRAFETLLDGLRKTGDPEALRLAAQAERQFFQNQIDNNIETAYQNAAERIARIKTDNRETREQIGKIVLDETMEGYRLGRDYEKALWRQAETESFDVTLGTRGLENATVSPRMLTPRNANRALLDAVSSVSDERWRNLPGSNTANGILRRFGINKEARDLYDQGKMPVEAGLRPSVADEYVKVDKDIAARDMIRARSELLELAREAAPTSPDAARIYHQMADGILEDLGSVSSPAYDRARAYSRELNDVYTRTFAGELTGPMRTGARRYAPETVIQLAFKSNTDLTAQRMKEVLNASHFLDLRYQRLLQELGPDHPQVRELAPFSEAALGPATSIAESQKRWLYLGANKALVPDPNNPMGPPRLNLKELQKFTAENESYLRQVGIWDDLQDAATAEIAFLAARDPKSAFNRGIQNRMAFANLLLDPKNPERALDPVMQVTQVLNSSSASSGLRNMAQMAKRSGPDAVAGLRATLLDYAATAANLGTAKYSPTAFYDALFQPISLKQPSVMQILRREGLISQLEANNYKRMLMPQMRIEAASTDPTQLAELANKPLSPIQRLAVRYAGARAGSVLARGAGSGASIQIPGYVASTFENILSNQPNILITGALERMASDPQLLADMLTQANPNTPSGREVIRRVTTRLGISGFAAGIPATANLFMYTPPSEQRQDQPLGAFSSGSVPRPRPPAPPARGVPGVPAGTPPAPQGQGPAPVPLGAAGAPPPAAPTTNSRQLLQQLFPEDATLRVG